jgi:hypothetical protein
MGKPIIWNGANAKLINSGDLIDSKANSLTNGGKANYTWTGHLLTVGGTADIGRPVYLINATTLAFADQTLSANAEVLGFIYAVLDANTVRLSFSGEIPTVGSNFLEGGGSLVPGTVYFLAATAGKVTATEPTTIGYVSKPLGVAASTTRFTTFNMRGSVVGSANARTQITLANNATTTVQDVSLYDAGSIEGWVFIDAPTDIRFYVKAPFSKYGAAANYYISPSYVGDTPPTGYSMTITAAGLIQITLPSIASFTSAVINFALNAPAVGTNFPLNLDSANLTNSGITGLTGTAATTATTVGSLKVGEIYSSTLSIVTATFTGGVTGVATMASITLTAGVWLIIAEDSCYNATRGTAGTSSAGGSDLYDGTATIVDGQQAAIVYGTANNLDAEAFRAIHHNFYTLTTGTKTISFRLKCNANAGLPNGATVSNRGYGYLKAIRIA